MSQADAHHITDLVHGIESPIANLRYGCDALFNIAESIGNDNENDANAVYFCARAMRAEVKKLQGLYARSN